MNKMRHVTFSHIFRNLSSKSFILLLTLLQTTQDEMKKPYQNIIYFFISYFLIQFTKFVHKKKHKATGHVTAVGGACDLTGIYIMTHTQTQTLKGNHFAVNNMTVRMSDGSH